MKKVFLLLTLFIFTGCDVIYNLEIKDSFTENIKININDPDFDINDSEVKIMLETDLPLYRDFDGAPFYQTKVLSNENGVNIIFDGKFSTLNNNSNAVFNACDDYSIYQNGNNIVLKASNFNIFDINPYVDTITVNIICKNSVVKNNADRVKNNKYTWIIDKDNYEDKTIELEYIPSGGGTFTIGTLLLLIGGIIVIVFAGYLVFLLVQHKNKINNEL